ncbi:flagellar hook-length control protein FliK [Xenorhabdus sp. TH1]|uniref:flagellar hook-length control protein FliK n=1 Tax=Xenorhabdus sp. TH1 TaxID=3130166 RepID=UPI0030D3AABE
MNLTLLPTDLKFTDKGTDKSQPTLHNTVIDNHSSQFGQLLDAETASIQKSTTQVDKNSLKEEKFTTDNTTESGWSQLVTVTEKAVSDNNVVKDKPHVETVLQENNAKFAALNNEESLPTKTLSAAVPNPLAGLLNSHTNSTVLPENSHELMDNTPLENSLLQNSSPEIVVLNNNDLSPTESISTKTPIQQAGLPGSHTNSAVPPENSHELRDNGSLENSLPELAASNNEDPLSIEALNAAMPIQLAGLLNRHVSPTVFSENSPELMGDAFLKNSLLESSAPEFAALNNEELLPAEALRTKTAIQPAELFNPHTNSVVLSENPYKLMGNASLENSLLQNSSEFAILNNGDHSQAKTSSTAIPTQLTGLFTAHTNSAVLSENAHEVMDSESLENLLLSNEGRDNANNTTSILLDNSTKNGKLTHPNLTEQFSKAGEQDKNIQLSAKQEIPLNNKTENPVNFQAELVPLPTQPKLDINNLATNNKTEFRNVIPEDAVSANSKAPNLPQMAVQTAPALTTSMAETTSVDLPTVLATPSLFSAGQQTGQFQLNNSTTTPLLSAHLGSEEWQQQLNQHVLFFNRNGLQQAELRLHPQELGALHIHMSVEDNQAQLHFVSAHQHVRAALEAALPGLRHALAESGIQLAQSSVNSDTQGSGQQEYFADNHANNSNSNSKSHAETQESGLAAARGITPSHASTIQVTPQQMTSVRGGIDTFA